MSGGAAPADSLNEEEKEKVRYHLGYLETSFAPSIQFGIPRPLQTVFLLEQGLDLLVNGYAVNRVRCILKILDNIESVLYSNVETVAADKVGTLQLHPLKEQGQLATDSIEKEYKRWAGRLADIFGVPPYPFSSRFQRSGPGSNVRVK